MYLQSLGPFKHSNFVDFFLHKNFISPKMTQPCDEMLVTCKYGSELLHCSDIFETTLTDDGLCCTFNQAHQKFIEQNYRWDDTALHSFGINEKKLTSVCVPFRVEDDFDIFENSKYHPVDWDPENGYGNQIKSKYMYPRVAAGNSLNFSWPSKTNYELDFFIGPGKSLGLTIILNSNYNDYYCSSTNSAGFKVKTVRRKLIFPDIFTISLNLNRKNVSSYFIVRWKRRS